MSDSDLVILYLVLFIVAVTAAWAIIKKRQKTTNPFLKRFLTAGTLLIGALAGMMGVGLLTVSSLYLPSLFWSLVGVIALLSLGWILRRRPDGERALGWFRSLPHRISRSGTGLFFLVMVVVSVFIIVAISNDEPHKEPDNTAYPSSTAGEHTVLPLEAPEEHVILPIRTLFPTYITTWKNINRSNIKVKSELGGDLGLLEQAVAYYEPRDRFLGTETVVQLAIMIDRYETVEEACKRHGGPVVPASWGAKNSNFGWVIGGRSMELAPGNAMVDVGSVGDVFSIRVMTNIMGTYRVQIALLGFGNYAISGDGLVAVISALDVIQRNWP